MSKLTDQLFKHISTNVFSTQQAQIIENTLNISSIRCDNMLTDNKGWSFQMNNVLMIKFELSCLSNIEKENLLFKIL